MKIILILTGLLLSLSIVAQDRPDPQPAPDTFEKFNVGMAGYTFVNFDLDKTLETMEKCDVKYLCIKDFHLPFKSTDQEIADFHAKLKAKGVNVIHFLGFGTQEVVYYADEFQALGETRFSTDDGTFGLQGNVGNLLLAEENQPNAVFACGNNGLLKTVEQLYAEVDNVQLSLESRMACGMGACYACVCHVPEEENKSVKVCEDGPVFQAGEVIF